MLCISCNRILDSCRDKDCFEDVRVYLTDCGQEIVEKTGSVRIKCARIVWTQLLPEPLQFNRGFYSVNVRFYVKITAEACVCPGKTQEIEGIAACEKKVILYGGEGSTSVFRSSPEENGFCTPLPSYEDKDCCETNYPSAVCEVADPVVLDARILERKEHRKCCCCCCVDEIPEKVCRIAAGNLTDTYDDGKILVVTMGFFSVIRLERPGQFVISGSEYCVPEKECVSPEENDPCALFRRMSFPVGEFCTSPPKTGGCGCSSRD